MTELQNDRQDKNNMPPDLRSRGHKNCYIDCCRKMNLIKTETFPGVHGKL